MRGPLIIWGPLFFGEAPEAMFPGLLLELDRLLRLGVRLGPILPQTPDTDPVKEPEDLAAAPFAGDPAPIIPVGGYSVLIRFFGSADRAKDQSREPLVFIGFSRVDHFGPEILSPHRYHLVTLKPVVEKGITLHRLLSDAISLVLGQKWREILNSVRRNMP